MMTDEEVELVRRAAGQDLAAFAALVRAHEPRLRRYTRRLASDDGDDIAQETLLAAWRALRQWRGEGNFAAWLRAIATRRYLDRRRRAGPRHSAVLDPLNIAPDAGPDRKIAVDRALLALPERERVAALLVFGEGHTHSEAAVILGVPLGTLKSILARSRMALISLLDGDC